MTALRASATLTLAGAIAIAVSLVPSGLAAGSPASRAACGEDPPLTAWSPEELQLKYGDYWSMTATTNQVNVIETPWSVSAQLTGEGAPLPTDSYFFKASGSDWCEATISVVPASGRPLDAGEYRLTGRFDNPYGSGFDTPEARIVVNPAALGIQARITADPSNPRHAIVSAAFTGQFVEDFSNGWGTTSNPSAPLTPAGHWSIVVIDGDGDIALDVQIDRVETDDALATSAYWADPPAGDYSVTAQFVPSGASASNFTFAEATPFRYTASGPPPDAVPTATPAPSLPPEATATGSAVPLFIPLILAVVTAGLLVFAAVQFIRTRRIRSAMSADDGVNA